ncbi:MAG: hypothetical protein ABL993_01295 [Vicinamibacterales bacterium]
MSYGLRGRTATALVGTAALVLTVYTSSGQAAQGRGGAPGAPPLSPWAAAPIDLTGYWVSVVNEDWRWRMVTPPKGDYASVPLNPEGSKQADTWQPTMDGQCEAYGAAALMRIPTRVHITWENDNTLKVETDAGQQTRRMKFSPGPAPAERSLQGHSAAEWERPVGVPRGPVIPGGTLKATTTMLRPGWLRKNGVPYSEDAQVTEYYDRFQAPNGDEWLVVTTIVHDPKYLTQDFVTSSHFKREADGAKWSPSPCKTA